MSIRACLILSVALAPQLAQAQDSGFDDRTLRPQMSYHGVSPTLRYLAQHPIPVGPGMGQRIEPEMDQLIDLEAGSPNAGEALLPSFMQTTALAPAALDPGTTFEGPGTGLPGFTMTGAPPDTTLAVGPNHIVAWVNSQYAVFNKAGAVLLGPVNGNALFVGLGNLCQTTNRGDPLVQYDRLADRWIFSQFAFAVSGGAPAAPYLQCFAVSTSGDPTGTYVRYTVTFSPTAPSGFNDFGKLGVWPDAYYSSYNIFQGSPAGSNSGAALCASDRTKMLAGDPTATTLCAPIGFYGGGAAFLPADLDGTTLPSDPTQGGLFMRYSFGGVSLRLMKLKPDFAASTVTLTNGFGGVPGTFVDLPVGPTTVACNGSSGACVPQPGTANVLDTLADRLNYRLAFRNLGGVESLLVTQSTDPDGAGARDATLRWYEVRNPLGNPADPNPALRPTIFQNGTYDPGAARDRWMGSIAMDGGGNIALGYSVAHAAAGLAPSIGIAAREPTDPPNTLQAEILAQIGTGSQTGTLTRWGDYTTMQVDPVDDRTFWFIGQYLAANGSFNWRTRIVSYRFPLPATLGIDDVAVTEGNSGSGNAQFTITRSNNLGAVSVTATTANDTATAGSDYTAVVGQVVNFSAGGALTATLNVSIAGDTTLEADETYTVNLGSPVNASISNGTGQGTIDNDDAASIEIDDVNLAEDNAGNTAFVFTVTLTGSVEGGFSVPFSTADGSAIQPDDYASDSGTLSFAGSAGETQTITVQVVGDTTVEGDETFTVELGTPSVAAVAVPDGSGLGTIGNDDNASIAIDDVTLAEGNAGDTAFTFSVTLTGSVQDGFTVPFSTANGTATQPGDYASNSGTLNFAGTAGESQSMTVQVVGDTTLEPNEAFTVGLGTPGNASVSVADGVGLGTITNDDAASVAINDVTLAEGNAGSTAFVFTVTLAGSVQGGFGVPFNTANGTATQPGDYASNSGTLTFAGNAGETRSITVQVVGDTTLEANETFIVQLATPNNGVTLGDGSGLGTISNDDNASIAINDRTLAEGNAGTSAFAFTVMLTGAVPGGFSVPFNTANGTAAQPGDYASNSGSLTFAGTNGETQSLTVQVVGETLVEGNETFTVALGAPSNGLVGVSDGSGLGTITNDDTATVSIANRTLAEGNAGTTAFGFTVTLAGSVQGGVSVPFSTANGTATQPADYASATGNAVFAGGNGEMQTINVAVAGELVPEPDETFVVVLGTPNVASVTVGNAQGTGTITNDDLFADIAVSVSNGLGSVVEGAPTSYVVTIGNTSTLIDVAAVQIAQTASAGLSGIAWTCSGSGGATCPVSGNGVIAQTLAMPRSSTLTFVAGATVAFGAASPVSTTVVAAAQAPASDPNAANNSATDSDPVTPDGILADGFE